MTGLSTIGSISFGTALEAGRKRVPRPAAGITALRTRVTVEQLLFRWRSTLRHFVRVRVQVRAPARVGSGRQTSVPGLAGAPAGAQPALPDSRGRTRALL